MSSERERILRGLSDSVVDMDEDTAAELSNEAVAQGIDALEVIDEGLADGMRRAGDLFESEEYFIPELLVCSDALNAGVEVLKPHIKVEGGAEKKTKVVIGVIEGDTHDIGKNLVKILVEAGGFEIIDLGRDVPAEKFVDTAIAEQADVIALSTLMTTTMLGMPKVVELLKEKGVREKHKVIVGGGPLSQAFSDKIGADGYSKNASEALKLVKTLVGRA
ncbi:MAG: corrinoid protein [Oscillospiraceae bacterium]|jgi:corrinoid protein of di/trimethylamine methyltransferase|nr:corrinoid protein [Oscillospiraceae bacterium]